MNVFVNFLFLLQLKLFSQLAFFPFNAKALRLQKPYEIFQRVNHLLCEAHWSKSFVFIAAFVGFVQPHFSSVACFLHTLVKCRIIIAFWWLAKALFLLKYGEWMRIWSLVCDFWMPIWCSTVFLISFLLQLSNSEPGLRWSTCLFMVMSPSGLLLLPFAASFSPLTSDLLIELILRYAVSRDWSRCKHAAKQRDATAQAFQEVSFWDCCGFVFFWSVFHWVLLLVSNDCSFCSEHSMWAWTGKTR